MIGFLILFRYLVICLDFVHKVATELAPRKGSSGSSMTLLSSHLDSSPGEVPGGGFSPSSSNKKRKKKKKSCSWIISYILFYVHIFDCLSVIVFTVFDTKANLTLELESLIFQRIETFLLYSKLRRSWKSCNKVQLIVSLTYIYFCVIP